MNVSNDLLVVSKSLQVQACNISMSKALDTVNQSSLPDYLIQIRNRRQVRECSSHGEVLCAGLLFGVKIKVYCGLCCRSRQFHCEGVGAPVT
jgi:hypothetical protein